VVISEGHEPITGDSLIVTENEQLDVPHELVAVQVTVDVPVMNVEPEAGEQTTVAAGDPVEVGLVHVATWLSHCTISEGHAAITGVSLIVTENEQLDVPQPLVAVQVTVEVPVMNVEPEAGLHVTTGVVPEAVGSVHVAVVLSH